MENANKGFVIGLIFVFAVMIILFVSFNVSALANPAAVYCKEMGYKYKIMKDKDGGEHGICETPDKKQNNEWDFYKKASADEIKRVSAKLGGEREERLKTNSEGRKLLISIEREEKGAYNATNYTFWDWRNPPLGTEWNSGNYSFFDTTHGWVTSIKNQGGCGSCWSFSTVAGIEAKYEINQNNSRLNSDLSEQHLVSCDNSCDGGACQLGCSGGYMDLALNYTRNYGISDEACFDYSGTDESCSNKCSDYASRLWTINGFGGGWLGSAYFALTNNQTMQYMIDEGPLIGAMGIGATMAGGGFNDDDSDGIYRCNNDTAVNHGILLIGYNYTGNESTSYWIIKNSWGTGWGDSGYFKLGFNECNFTYEFEWPYNVSSPSTFKPKVEANFPDDNYMTKDKTITFNFTAYLMNSTADASCDLMINNAVVNYSAQNITNATSAVLSYNLSNDGNYSWQVACWENDLGIINRSAARNLTVDNVAPYISIILPTNTTYTTNNITINISTNGEESIWFYNGTNNESYSSAITRLYADGQYSLIAYANDSAGNFNMTSATFFVDMTAPIITIINPSQGASLSAGTTETYINITTNEDAECRYNNTNSTFNFANGIVFNETNNQSHSFLLSGLSNGQTYTLYYKCNDTLGNVNNDSTAQSFSVANPNSDSPGSGSGGGGETPKTYNASDEEMAVGYTEGLKKGEKIKFGSHTLTMNYIGTNYANMTIMSNPIKIMLLAGQEMKLNLTSFGYYDLYVKLNSIANNIANVTIKAIYEKIAQEERELKKETGNMTGNERVLKTTSDTIRELGNIDNKYLVIGIVIIIMLVSALWWLGKR